MAMAMVVYICTIFASAFIIIAAANDECTYTKDTQTACTVDRGHVVCESRDLNASVRGIPACVTWITLSLQKTDYQINQNWQSIFAFLHGLPQLERLSIAVEQNKYHRIGTAWFANSWITTNLPKLKILQINVLSILTYDSAWTTSFHQSLQVLDLTRSMVGIVNAARFSRTLSAVQKLILRNIQSVTHFRNYVTNVNLTDFVCIGNVRYLDLSYNDLITISLGRMCWDTKLQELNLDHNMIAHVNSFGDGISSTLAFLETVQQLKILNVNYCKSTTPYHKDLWDDNDNRTSITGLEHDENIDPSLSVLNDVIPQTPLSLFAGYRSWLQGMMKHCGNINFLQVAKCIEYDEVCAFFNCVAPDFNVKACQDYHHGERAYEMFARQFCDYSASCLYNIQFPVPRSLTKISMREFGNFVHDRYLSKHPNESVLCLDPNNNLEIFDLTDAIWHNFYSYVGKYTVLGLKKLKFFSIQGCQILFVVNPLLFSDMESLEEVHIGGNRLFENDSLPAVMFRNNARLSVLNLSYSSLKGIESDAFINHKHLAVLDLSHNHLAASSLAALDLSNNNIKYLNLSFNSLTTLPASLRFHFDQFHDLVLDLSGNNFLCNCQHLDFLQWIQSNTAISFVYAGDHVCYDFPGNTIHNIEVDSLYCNWYWEQPTIAVGCSLLLFLLFLITFIIYRKRWVIRNLIFHLQERLSQHSDDNTDTTSYRYDAFVLYSSVESDRLWVHLKLVPELEKVYGFRLCIHHRNFLCYDIVDNIEAAIRCSRKVLVVMSENFVNSGWCVEEVQMTRSVDRNKFIVIMYSDVSAVRTPVVIQRLLETRTYIEWVEDAPAQALFWKKLRKALYTKTRRQQEQPANVESDSQAINLLPTWDILA